MLRAPERRPTADRRLRLDMPTHRGARAATTGRARHLGRSPMPACARRAISAPASPRACGVERDPRWPSLVVACGRSGRPSDASATSPLLSRARASSRIPPGPPSWYEAAAEQGDAHAQDMLTGCWSRATTARPTTSRRAWSGPLAAEQGVRGAMTRLGMIYHNALAWHATRRRPPLVAQGRRGGDADGRRCSAPPTSAPASPAIRSLRLSWQRAARAIRRAGLPASGQACRPRPPRALAEARAARAGAEPRHDRRHRRPYRSRQDGAGARADRRRYRPAGRRRRRAASPSISASPTCRAATAG